MSIYIYIYIYRSEANQEIPADLRELRGELNLMIEQLGVRMEILLQGIQVMHVGRITIQQMKDKLNSELPSKLFMECEQLFNEKNCTICFEEFHTHDTVRELKCKHIFHMTCIDIWALHPPEHGSGVDFR